jgi:two-component system response regulator NreC
VGHQYFVSGESPRASIAAPREASLRGGQQRSRTQILLLDEAGILRDGLCALLQSEKGIEVIAVAGSRREAMLALTAFRPQLLIMDFSVTLKTDPQTIAHLKRRWPQLRVLVLTLRRDEQLIEAALNAGADGYVLKNESRDELFTAVQRLSAGGTYVSPPALERVMNAHARTAERGGPGQPQSALTNREQEVIALIARGYRTREMAQLMSLSHKTVEKHRTNLMRKLGLRSAAAVAAYAITNGLV